MNSRHKVGKKKWHLGRIVKNIDSFGMEIPSFNIGGESQVNTLCGGIVTCLILMTTLAYASSEALELIDPHNPQINIVDHPYEFGNL